MLQFKKYEDITHWACGVYRARVFALKRNSRNHRMECGRHGCARADFSGTLIGPAATTYLWCHPGSLLWSIWLWGLVPQSGYFQIRITVFPFHIHFFWLQLWLQSLLQTVSLVIMLDFSLNEVILLHSMSHSWLLIVTQWGPSPHTPTIAREKGVRHLPWLNYKRLGMHKISLLLATMYELVNHPTLTVLLCLSSDHVNNPVREGGSISTPPGQMVTQVQRRDSLTYDPWGQHLPFVYGGWIYRLMLSLRFLILKYIYLSPTLFLVSMLVLLWLWK